jgi:hypothetical protein
MRRRLAIACAATAALAVAFASGAGAPSASGRSLAARLTAVGHADPGGGESGDVYARDGYAYLGSWRGATCPSQGVRVFDIRSPKTPRLVSSFGDVARESDVSSSWTEKVIVKPVQTASFRGNLAVTSFQLCHPGGFQGFGLYDVRDPAHPRRLALVHTTPRGSHEIWLAAKGKRAYVYTAIPFSEWESSPDFDAKRYTATTPGEPDFRIYDVTNPRKPVEVGSWGAWKVLGVKPATGRGRYKANYVHSVITNAAATRAYLSYWDLGTVILDISNPREPRYLGRTNAAGDPEGDAHSAALAHRGKIMIETHEHESSAPSLYDISNPRRPRKLADFRPPTPEPAPVKGAPYYTNGVHDPKVRGNLAYFSWYRRGVVVADITKPSRPRYVASFVPPPAADQGGGVVCGSPCTMTWGVFVMPNGLVLASDMTSGLWILRLRS